MSALSRSKSQRTIYVNPHNFDVYDTLNPLLQYLPTNSVPDTPENRVNAALAVSYQLAQQIETLKREVDNMNYRVNSLESLKFMR